MSSSNTKNDTQNTILIVEDDEGLNKLISKRLAREGFMTNSVYNGKEAISRIAMDTFMILLLDYMLPDMTGEGLLKELSKKGWNLPFVVMTGHGDERIAVNMMKLGAADYIVKDGNFIDLIPQKIKIVCESVKQKRRLTASAEEKKKADKALRESEAKFKSFFENAPIYCYRISNDGKIIDINKYALEVLGYKKEEILNKSLLTTIYSPSSINKATELFKQWKKAGKIENKELDIITKDGEERTILLSAEAVKDNKGEILYSISVQRDITARKRIEEELKNREDFLNEVGSIAEIGGWEMDLVTRKAKWTKGTYDIVEIDYSDPIPGPDEHVDYYLPEFRPLVENAMKKLIDNDEPLEYEAKYRTAKGNIRWGRILGKAIRKNGKCIKVFGTVQNITERKIAEEELKRTKDELEVKVIERTKQLQDKVKALDKSQQAMLFMIEDLNKTSADLRNAQDELLIKERLAVLGQFSGSISHELRNPLGVIDSSAYYLKMKLKDSDEKAKQHLDRISVSVENATSIIQSLLNLTRMKKPDAGMNKLADIISSSITSSKLPVTIEVIQNFPKEEIYVKVESEQCQIAFKNIIKNAIEAMKGEGKLTITIRKTKDKMTEVSFKDTGSGISPENIKKVFQPLFSTKARGIGFGLSIAKMIIENHKGTIRAESNEGEGAEFVVSLPLYKSKSKM